MEKLRLGVNIDHVATIRNARGGGHPNPLRAARLAVVAGADGITAHLREDRRHISDADIAALSEDIPLPLNLEMAATEEMLAIALRHTPQFCCLVPERREEVTTEGGLEVAGKHDELKPYVDRLKEAGIQVTLFIDPDEAQVAASATLDVPIVELHTGAYCDAADEEGRARELERLRRASAHAAGLGIEVHAGHGLSYETVGPVAAIGELVELNIGHFLIGEAVFVGLENAIRRMRDAMDAGRRRAFTRAAQ